MEAIVIDEDDGLSCLSCFCALHAAPNVSTSYLLLVQVVKRNQYVVILQRYIIYLVSFDVIFRIGLA